MDKIRIITDTSSDISVEDAERWDIELLPVLFQIDGKPCYESIDFTNEEFYEMMPEYEKNDGCADPGRCVSGSVR